jgi:ribonuclease I
MNQSHFCFSPPHSEKNLASILLFWFILAPQNGSRSCNLERHGWKKHGSCNSAEHGKEDRPLQYFRELLDKGEAAPTSSINDILLKEEARVSHVALL